MDMEKDTISMDDFMNSIDSTMKHLRKGQVIKGTVISVNDKEAMINIGYMSDGVIPAEEISFDKNLNLSDALKENDEINVYIVDMNDGEGNVLLSKKRADAIVVWDELKDLMDKKQIIEVKCDEVVKGGIITYYKGIRMFIPASQVSTSFVKDLNEFLGKELEARIIEVNKNDKKVVVSAREVENEKKEAKKEEVWSQLKVGEKRTGKVRKLTKFGAFVDLGGIDGLIHLSELSWNKIKDASEVVSEGDTVEVFILNIDKDKKRIALGYKNKEDNPWNKALEKYTIGTITEGKVAKVANYGVFVQLDNNVQGLVHVSQISDEEFVKPTTAFEIGDKVKVKVINVDDTNKKIALSIKDAVVKEKEDFSEFVDNNQVGTSLADLLKNFK